MVATANNSRAAIGCSPFCKFSEKGVALSLDGCLQQIPSALAEKISQWVCDRISTGEINDGSVVHGGASLNGWLDVWQRHSNQMHRRHSNRPDTRFTHSSGDLEADHFEAGTDRVFYPRMAWVTGKLNVHDMVWTDAGQLVFVNTAFDCLATVDPTWSFRPLWQPEFLAGKDPSARDCCHLNGLCLQDGEIAYATALGKSTQAGGWRAHKSSGGLLFDVRSGELLCDRLSMPHSPRWHDGHLWLLNSGTGEFGQFDLASATFEPVAFCPGFARGLAFHKHWALITLSDMRRANGFQGLALGERLQARGVGPGCGLLVVDMRSGTIEHWLSVKGNLREFYDVAVLAGVRCPSIVNMEQSITRDIHLPPPAGSFSSAAHPVGATRTRHYSDNN